MSPSSILQIKKLIRTVTYKQAQDVAKKAMELSTGSRGGGILIGTTA
jgi:phosphoenolpyruvate-protein kinase (PTS system EI component)